MIWRKKLHYIGQNEFPISFKAPEVAVPVDKNVITFSSADVYILLLSYSVIRNKVRHIVIWLYKTLETSPTEMKTFFN